MGLSSSSGPELRGRRSRCKTVLPPQTTFKVNAADLASDKVTGGGNGSDNLYIAGSGVADTNGVTGVGNFYLTGSSETLQIAAGSVKTAISAADNSGGNTIDGRAVTAGHTLYLYSAMSAGRTTVMAGAGVNNFGLRSAAAALTISGFQSGRDHIGFSESAFGLGASPLATALFSSKTDGSFANTGNRFAYDTTGGVLYHSPDGQTADRVAIATLTAHPSLAAADLYFFT